VAPFLSCPPYLGTKAGAVLRFLPRRDPFGMGEQRKWRSILQTQRI